MQGEIYAERSLDVEVSSFGEFIRAIFLGIVAIMILSAGSALLLFGKGYTNVSALLGGIAAWEKAGYPMEES